MNFDIITLFPDLFRSFCEASLIKKAIEKKTISISLTDPRVFSKDKHRKVDDEPYGGGSGMVLLPGPVVEAIESVDPSHNKHRILLTPQGMPLTQAKVTSLAQKKSLMFICGRYEGFDERIRNFVDEEISLGDFVLMGGEVAAMACIESIARFVPGVIGNQSSTTEESHSAGFLEYPQYTRPSVFRGLGVPQVLKSGNHAEIAAWRIKESKNRTAHRRPDLLEEMKEQKSQVQIKKGEA